MKSVAQTVIEADRFYTIAAHTGNVIQAVEGSKDGGTVRLGKYDHKPEQEWSFVREGDGVYRIRNRASGKLLDLTMTGTANAIADLIHYRPSDIELKVLTVVEPETFSGKTTVQLADEIYQMMAQDLGPDRVA